MEHQLSREEFNRARFVSSLQFAFVLDSISEFHDHKTATARVRSWRVGVGRFSCKIILMNFQQIFKNIYKISSRTFASCHDRIERRSRMHRDKAARLRCIVWPGTCPRCRRSPPSCRRCSRTQTESRIQRWATAVTC